MKKKFMAMGLTEALASDFAWLVSCAMSNAEYGYGVRELFISNATARDLMEISEHRMQRMIELAGLVGWNIAAEDIAEANVKMREFKAEAIKQGYIIA